MTPKQKVMAQVEALGFDLEDDGFTVYLDAPKGFWFVSGSHTLCTDYETSGKTSAFWKSILEDMRLIEPCSINNCEWGCDAK